MFDGNDKIPPPPKKKTQFHERNGSLLRINGLLLFRRQLVRVYISNEYLKGIKKKKQTHLTKKHSQHITGKICSLKFYKVKDDIQFMSQHTINFNTKAAVKVIKASFPCFPLLFPKINVFHLTFHDPIKIIRLHASLKVTCLR